MIEVPFVAEDSTDTLYTLSHGGMIDVLFVAEDSTDTLYTWTSCEFLH